MRIFMDRFRKSFSEYSSMIVILAVMTCLVIMKDTGTTAALCWLAVVFSVSFFMRPYLPAKSLKYPDNGFGLSFGLGLFLCFFAAWTFSAVTGIEFADPVAYMSFAVFAVAGYAVKKYVLKQPYVTMAEFRMHLNGFAVFSVIFLAFFWMIGFNPLVDPGTENYMAFGFMQTIYRQRSAIPFDPWFATTKLNYYYLGQAASVYMCRLARTTPEFGYNMMLATFIGMVFVMVYELVTGIAGYLSGNAEENRKSSVCGGIFGASVAAFGANPHWLVWGILARLVNKTLGDGALDGYWFPDGTVYINRELGDPDNGKNEFPAYSVILGDLHAHVINVIFVLPLLAVLFDLCMCEKEREKRSQGIYSIIIISLLLAYYKGANYWDFAIYYVITGAVIVFSDIRRKGFSIKTFVRIAVKAAAVTAISVAAILPFTLNFIKMESGIKLCETHTPVGKLAVLWLLPVAVTICLIVFMYKKNTSTIVPQRVGCISVLAFALCTIGLLIVPETVYVNDIYGADNQRFNTMFKLTYQAFILFAVLIGIMFALLLIRQRMKRSDERRAYPVIVCFVIVAIMDISYTPYSAHQWFGDIWDKDERIGISSLEGLYTDDFYGFEMKAYDILAKDDRKVINIIEMAGDSYSHESSLSVYSGACTPVGWFVHEWMWHNDPEPVSERADEVARFYRSGDEGYCRDIIKKYDIDYIFVGPAEVCKYPVNRNGFWNLGEVCVDEIWQDCELALIKVDRTRIE